MLPVMPSSIGYRIINGEMPLNHFGQRVRPCCIRRSLTLSPSFSTHLSFPTHSTPVATDFRAAWGYSSISTHTQAPDNPEFKGDEQ